MIKKKNEEKIPISKRALVQRINRRLAKQDEALKATRGDRWRQELGDYFVVDLRHDAVIHKDVNLEDIGHHLGVLKPWERLGE